MLLVFVGFELGTISMGGHKAGDGFLIDPKNIQNIQKNVYRSKLMLLQTFSV